VNRRRTAPCLLIALSAWVVFNRPARAATAPIFYVNSSADVVGLFGKTSGTCETAPLNGICTLRRAVIEANRWPGGGATIDLTGLPGGVAALTIAPSGLPDDAYTGDLDLLASMTIVGAGAGATAVDGSNLDTVFRADASGTVISISGLTIRHGRKQTGGGLDVGPGVSMTLANSAVSENTAFQGPGGGIVNGGMLTLVNTSVAGNSTAYQGGGIDNYGSLVVDHSTVLFNTASTFGGGIDSYGTLTIVDSLIAANSANTNAGGIFFGGTMLLSRSTVSGNTAGGSGGGIFGGYTNTVNSGSLVQSTISSNQAALDGGGLMATGSTTTVQVYYSTIVNNRANSDGNLSGTGGGVAVATGTGASLTLTHTIVARDVQGTGPGAFNNDCAGIVTSVGNNLVGTAFGCGVNGPYIAGDPMIGPLASNGGPTPTHALLAGSPAIDAGQSGACSAGGNSLGTDQRGVPRPSPAGGGCDLGSFERTAPAAFNKTSPATATTGLGTTIGLSWQASAGAASYEYCVDLSNNNTCDNAAGWVPTTATSATISVNSGTTYFWQVRALGFDGSIDANGGAWWTLKTAPTLPLYPPDRGDFTGDGRPDLIWQHPTTGAVLLWEMNGSGLVSGTMLNAGGTLWQVVGVGDFTGDGHADLLWQHPQTGALLLWEMDGATYVGYDLLTSGGTMWKVAAVADFTGDGKPDIIWQHPTTGAVLLWQMEGTTYVGGAILNAGGTLWKVVGANDFTGDGKPDLLWQHPATGAVLLWAMNGSVFVSGVILNSGGTLWQIVATGDFTGDGKPDLIWQYPTSGAVLLWAMDGSTYTGGAVINPGGTPWKIRSPR
jgi:hypothetical protein